MQLQLSLAVADRLHETLLVRGEPIDALEAACLLTASSECPVSLSRQILDSLVMEDRRFCWNDASGAGEKRIGLRRWESHDPRLIDVPFVALDLETTGARPGAGKITEIGAVRIEGLREVARFSTLVNPMRPIPRMITEITGITPQMVAGAPRIEEVMLELLTFLEGALVVAHNAGFDVGFLNYELRRLRGRELGDGAIDTLPLARALAPGLPNYKLATVAEALGSPVTACHRALADALAAGHVFVTLMELLRERGVVHLSEARSYMMPSAHNSIEKLSLTRDIPAAPGTYTFADGQDRVLFVGRADSLREHVRSHFVGSPSSARKMRQAVRLVERIAWEQTLTPLEAVVREQQLVLKHRPTCNQFGSRPEAYVYLKAGGSGSGLRLYASSRSPKGVTRSGESTKPERTPIVLGPFRGRSRLTSALDLLQRSYPIRSCTRHPQERPCPRGVAGDCLAPCVGQEAARQEHDQLVHGLISWLAGDAAASLLIDPVAHVEGLMRRWSREGRQDETRELRQALDDLISVKRSYAAMTEAHSLRFAALVPQAPNGRGPSVRLNVVWDGRLLSPLSLSGDDLEQKIETLVAEHMTYDRDDYPEGNDTFLAVPQDEVDTLLAVRRWFKEQERPAMVLLPLTGRSRPHLEAWKDRLTTEARLLLNG